MAPTPDSSAIHAPIMHIEPHLAWVVMGSGRSRDRETFVVAPFAHGVPNVAVGTRLWIRQKEEPLTYHPIHPDLRLYTHVGEPQTGFDPAVAMLGGVGHWLSASVGPLVGPTYAGGLLSLAIHIPVGEHYTVGLNSEAWRTYAFEDNHLLMGGQLSVTFSGLPAALRHLHRS